MPEQIFYLLHWRDETDHRCTNDLYSTLDMAAEQGFEKYNNLFGSPNNIPKDEQLAEFKNLLIYPRKSKDNKGFGYYQIYILPLLEIPPKEIFEAIDSSDEESSDE